MMGGEPSSKMEVAAPCVERGSRMVGGDEPG